MDKINVFIIPSWYPSQTNEHYGIFVRETGAGGLQDIAPS